jgi:hypothetical protein
MSEAQVAESFAVNVPTSGPWFVGEFFRPGHARTCFVCKRPIGVGEPAVANYDLKQTAHVGCGRIQFRRGR